MTRRWWRSSSAGRSSLRKMLATCFSTAPIETTRDPAMAVLARPSAMRAGTLPLSGGEPAERVAALGAGEELADDVGVTAPPAAYTCEAPNSADADAALPRTKIPLRHAPVRAQPSEAVRSRFPYGHRW